MILHTMSLNPFLLLYHFFTISIVFFTISILKYCLFRFQDIVFGSGLQTAVRMVLSQKGASPDDIMNSSPFANRWTDFVKMRADELINQRLQNQTAASAIDCDDDLPSSSPIQPVDLALRGSKGIERCAPDTQEYWDSFALTFIRQYVKLCVEPTSANGVNNEIANSALNAEFRGEAQKSTVAIILEVDNLQESAVRPLDRKPPPPQNTISKLLQGMLIARGGLANEDGGRVAPCDHDVLFLCDGNRESCKNALPGS